jgi:hypothetical protein
MAYELAKLVIDTQVTRLTASIDAARAERQGLAGQRDALLDTISSLQAQKDDLQAAKAALGG